MTHYTIVLTRFQPAPDGQQGLSESERLAQAFGISLERAEGYVQTVPCVVKRNATLEEAKRYQALLGRIGAVVELRPLDGGAQVASAGPAATPAPSLIPPPLAATATAPTAAAIDTISFLGGVHRALLAPLRGAGILWLLCLSGVLFVVAAATAIPCFGLIIAAAIMPLYCGLYREMFAYGVAYGAGDVPRALTLSDLMGLRGRATELAVNGLVIMVVAGLLLGATGYAWSALRLSDGSVQVCANPSSTQAAPAKTEAEPDVGRSAAREPGASEAPPPPKARPRQGCMSAPALSARGFALAWLMVFVQALYWPMALTVSCLTESITGLFRIGPITRGIYAGGWDYVVIVVLATTGLTSVILIPTLIAAWGSLFGAIALLLAPLPWVTYVGCAVGYLMGRMVEARADELGFLDE